MTELREMPCQELVEVITDYLEGRLPEEDRLRFEAHLEPCGKCREYLAQFEATLRAVGELRETSIRPEAKQALLEAFRGWRPSSAS